MNRANKLHFSFFDGKAKHKSIYKGHKIKIDEGKLDR